MTARRAPVIAGAGLASGMRLSIDAAKTPRTSFFARGFATYARSKHVKQKTLLAINRMQIQERGGITDDVFFTPSAAVRAHSRIKPRVVARGRSNNTSGKVETGVGFIDPRRSRIKSPRSQEYLLRVDNATEMSEEESRIIQERKKSSNSGASNEDSL